MAAAPNGSAALAGLITKQIRQLLAETTALASHLKLLKDLVSNPVIHRNQTQKQALDAVRRLTKLEDRADKLWSAIGSATEKLPRDERRQRRREAEKLISRLDAAFADVDKSARALMTEIERLRRSEVIDSPAEGALQVTLTVIQAITTAWRGWKKMRERTLR